jgi:nucleoside-diphosphate-sugar epimerase
MRSALVVGGSGPTGQSVVRGLIERGFDVSVFHTGQHEVAHPPSVGHLHGDPHFPESIADTIGPREFDVVIAHYGRLVHLVDYLASRTGQLVAIGSATRIVASETSPVWTGLGKPAVVAEEWIAPGSDRLESQPEQKLSRRVVQAYERLFEASRRVGIAATYLGYPVLYGPRQPGCREWSIVRRLLDGRTHIVLADGGMKLESRAFTENVAQAPLLVVDQPEVSAGKTYVVTDADLYTQRRRVEHIARYMGCRIEIVDIPYELALPSHPFLGSARDHRIVGSSRIRRELGYRDIFDAATALERTVDWLVQMPPEVRTETETQLRDPFDYAKEDLLVQSWTELADRMRGIDYPLAGYAHVYRHPKELGDGWLPPQPVAPPPGG